MDIFDSVIKDFEDLISESNLQRKDSGIPPLSFCEVKVLGQFSLFLDKDLAKNLRLAATSDVDALFSGDIGSMELFRKAVKKNKLVYDELSAQIWLPPGAKFELVHESAFARITRLDSISALVAKAVKAPAKNKFLIEQALQYYGPKIEAELLKCKIDLDEFRIKRGPKR